jgi:hypothetical protein
MNTLVSSQQDENFSSNRFKVFLTNVLQKVKVFRFFLSELRFFRSVLQLVSSLFRAKKFFGSHQVTLFNPWIQNSFKAPAPNIVKWQVLQHWGGRDTWLETGTYRGETTAYLSGIATMVHSLEPKKDLFERAQLRFIDTDNVKVHLGSSEEKFPELIQNLCENQVKDISFWLDGHFSAGETYMGEEETPILFELDSISKKFEMFEKLSIFVDDVRLFGTPEDKKNSYPTLFSLATFAEHHKLYWVIEQDIFIMTNRIKKRD